jgi:hypothetical protein
MLAASARLPAWGTSRVSSEASNISTISTRTSQAPRQGIVSSSRNVPSNRADLVELDGLEVIVIIDNELDVMSPPPPDTVQSTGTLIDVAMMSHLPPNTRGDAETELRMDNICCSAHGLSVLVVGTVLSVCEN